MNSGHPPGAYDALPPYEEDASKPSPATTSKQDSGAQPSDHTVQLNIDHGLGEMPPLLTTITITPSTTFEDFQRQVKQRYIELPRSGTGSFIWSTWLCGGTGRNGESDDREYIDVSEWHVLRSRIIRLSAARVLGWKNRPCKLECTFRSAQWGHMQKAKNAHQLERMLRLHQASERRLLLEGRHMPAPYMKQDECVLM